SKRAEENRGPETSSQAGFVIHRIRSRKEADYQILGPAQDVAVVSVDCVASNRLARPARRSARRRRESMLEQRGYVMLHRVQLVELQIGINNRKQVTCLRLLVNKNTASISNELFFDLEETFALEHDRQDVACGNVVRIVQFDDLPEKRFCCLFLNGLRRRRRS